MDRNSKTCAEIGRRASGQIATQAGKSASVRNFQKWGKDIFLVRLKRRNNNNLQNNQAGKFASGQIQFLAHLKQRKINEIKRTKRATLKGRGKGLSACLSSTLGSLSLPGRERNSHPAMRIKKCCST